jgi:hypothetical protein
MIFSFFIFIFVIKNKKMRKETHDALLNYLWEITGTDKTYFCRGDIKIHIIKSTLTDYKTVKYSVIKNGNFVKHTHLIKLDILKKIERDKKICDILYVD